MKSPETNLARETRFAKSLYRDLSKSLLRALKDLIQRHQVSVANGDVKYFDGGWYVTHSGLVRLADRRRCAGIHSSPVLESSDPATSRWVFRATVFKSRACKAIDAFAKSLRKKVVCHFLPEDQRPAHCRARCHYACRWGCPDGRLSTAEGSHVIGV